VDDLQRILSTGSERGGLYRVGFTNLVLFIPRYLLILGLCNCLALVCLPPEMIWILGLNWSGSSRVLLPKVINFHVPLRIKGLLWPGYFAAFMPTFSAFVKMPVQRIW